MSSIESTSDHHRQQQPPERPVSGRSLGIVGSSAQKRLRTEAATQGFLYVASFYVTWTPLFVIQVMGGSFGYTKEDQEKIYWLLVINAFLLPLQGLFNVFIYVRPTYTRFRARYPEEPALRVLRHALFDPNIPKLTTASVRSSEPSSGYFRFKFKRRMMIKTASPPSLSKQKPIHQPGKPLVPINESYSREIAALREDDEEKNTRSGGAGGVGGGRPATSGAAEQKDKEDPTTTSFEEETAHWVTTSSGVGGGGNDRAAPPASDRV